MPTMTKLQTIMKDVILPYAKYIIADDTIHRVYVGDDWDAAFELLQKRRNGDNKKPLQMTAAFRSMILRNHNTATV